MPVEYIYEPWKAPIKVQRACGCVVGRDYPEPICDPDAAAAANLRRMDACYRSAPEDWKALIPSGAAAEVAKERGVNVRSARRTDDTFVPHAQQGQSPQPPVEREQHRGTGRSPVGCGACSRPRTRTRAGSGRTHTESAARHVRESDKS
jgi:hypothetical protein